MISRLPGLTLPERVWNTARRWAVAWWRILYLGAVVLVLVLSPSSYGKGTRRALARHLYLDTAPVLLGFTVLAALISLVLTRIVVVTALSYGLSRYALEMVIRVLVLEL
ncbi:MAG TPA: ABC transporter permease, partial [Acidovorax sp.]|nr:ABC transporter permease [Acidovorax sp.]